MSGFRPIAYLAAPIVVLSLAGCGADIVDRSPDGLTLRWYQGVSDETQAREVARVYCAGAGKSVELLGLEQDGTALMARYRCA